MKEVVSLLSLVEGCSFREFVFGVLTGVSAICVNPYSVCCWIPPLGSSFLTWSGGLRFLRKSSSIFGKSCLVGLTLLIGLLGELHLLGLFVACFVGRRRRTLDIWGRGMIKSFLPDFGVSYAGHWSVGATIEEPTSTLQRERDFLMGFLGVCNMGYLWGWGWGGGE